MSYLTPCIALYSLYTIFEKMVVKLLKDVCFSPTQLYENSFNIDALFYIEYTVSKLKQY